MGQACAKRALTCGLRMFLQVRLYKWAYRNNLELIEMSEVQRSANQLVSQTAPSVSTRDFSVDKGNAVLCAAVLQHCFLIPQRYLKLALGFIVRNRIAIHKTAAPPSADSTRMPPRGNRLL
jgi:hypothetical protein